MKAYGEFIIVSIVEKTVTEAGIHLVNKVEKHYNEGVVKSIGNKVEGLKEGYTVMFGDGGTLLELHEKDTYRESLVAIRPFIIIGVK